MSRWIVTWAFADNSVLCCRSLRAPPKSAVLRVSLGRQFCWNVLTVSWGSSIRRCETPTTAMGKDGRCLDMYLAVDAIPTSNSIYRMGYIHPLGSLSHHCRSSLISFSSITNGQLVSWAYITATTQVYDHPITQDPHNSRRCCNALLDYVLASVGRVEPREGLGDLIATSAGLLDSEHAGGRLMQREMGALLWRLVMSSGKGEGKKRRQSIYSP